MRPGTDVLAALPLFTSFGAPQIAMLNKIADLARVGPEEVLFREGDRLGELPHPASTGFVTETHAHHDGDAFTDVVSPVKPIGFASAMLGAASPTVPGRSPRPGSSSFRQPSCGP